MIEPNTDGRGETAPPAASRAWRLLSEMELLISGAVIFSLFRLPGPLQRLFFRLENGLSEELFLPPFLVFYLGNLLVLTLIVCFSVHFLLRSFWVALAGLNHVFPEGIRWQELDQAPIQKRLSRQQFPSTRELERRLDRMASTIFSILFFVILQLLFVFLALGLAMALLLVVGRLLFPSLRGNLLFWSGFALLYLPLMAAALLDQWFKKKPARLERRPRLAAAVAAVFRFYYRLLFSRLYTPIQLTFASNISARKTTVGLIVAVGVVVSLYLLTMLVGSGSVGFDSYVYFPEAGGARTLGAEHYESLAGDGLREPLPTIQSEQIDGPWVRLFVPYRARWDGRRMEEVCPKTEPLRDEGLFLRRAVRNRPVDRERRDELLRCLASLYEIELNGERLAELDFSFHRQPGSGLRGLVAFIPTAKLPRGRNLLVVRRPLSKSQLAELTDPAARRQKVERRTSYIPFWR